MGAAIAAPSRVPIHMGAGPDGTVYQIGQMAGTEQETLTVQQITNHTHPFVASTAAAEQSTPQNNVLAVNPGSVKVLLQDVVSTQMSAQSITPVGGSQPHENTQPFLCINYIISLYGIFPSPT